jgi:pyruvate/2-oxoglutarate dehydrogenase complex dihydrolipoamide dehydrogenase (E3) component
MSGEYDLVVVGRSAAGVAAATKAAQLNARVALVDQGISTVQTLGVTQQVLLQVGRSRHTLDRPWPLDSSYSRPADLDRATLAAQIDRWTQAATAQIESLNASAILATLGIEVIAGQGAFHRRPRLGFEVQGRSLRSRAYFLAPNFCPGKPTITGLTIAGLQSTQFLDIHSFRFADLGLAHQVVILGGGAASVELAQALTRLGLTVTLTTPGRLLPQEDPEAAHLIQAHLEAEGVKVLSHTEVTQVRQIQDQKWVQVGDQAIATDQILLETTLYPQWEPLNLAAAAVGWSPEGIVLNDQLQTTNPRIYAGSPQGYSAPQIAISEAHRAIDYALNGTRSRLSLHSLPQVVYTDPELVRVGLTEPQALQQHGKAVQILRQSCQTLTQAQIQDAASGFCKLIVDRKGVILGAHWVGKHASESIGPIALAMQQNLKIGAIADLVLPEPSFAALALPTAAGWYQGRSQNFWQQWVRAWRGR